MTTASIKLLGLEIATVEIRHEERVQTVFDIGEVVLSERRQVGEYLKQTVKALPGAFARLL